MTNQRRGSLVVPCHLPAMYAPTKIRDIGQDVLRLAIMEAIAVRAIAARKRLTKHPLAPLIDFWAEERPGAPFALPDSRQFHDRGAHHCRKAFENMVDDKRGMRLIAEKAFIGGAVAVIVHHIAPWHRPAGIA